VAFWIPIFEEWGMKKQIFLYCLFFCLFTIFGARIGTADEKVQNMETVIIDDFDNDTTLKGKPREWFWYVRGSKFVVEESLNWKLVPAYPDTLFSKKQVEGKDLRVLGIQGSFDRKGYNSYEVIPVTKDDKGKIIPRSIELPGKVKAIDLWVWGSNFNYYIEVYLLDSRGVNHRLFLGDLTFEGWKNLSVSVPESIPQSRRYIPKHEALYLTKLVIWTRPDERVNDFYVYFDHLKVNTDTFISKFDGDEMADIDEVNRMWKDGKSIQP
jgi:hypothetical protein